MVEGNTIKKIKGEIEMKLSFFQIRSIMLDTTHESRVKTLALWGESLSGGNKKSSTWLDLLNILKIPFAPTVRGAYIEPREHFLKSLHHCPERLLEVVDLRLFLKLDEMGYRDNPENIMEILAYGKKRHELQTYLMFCVETEYGGRDKSEFSVEVFPTLEKYL